MPLKDHKAELAAAAAVATLVKFQAHRKLESSLRVGRAIAAVAVLKEVQETQLDLIDKIGTSWGAWA